MVEQQAFTDDQVLAAVEKYVYNRHRHLTESNMLAAGFDEEELARISTTGGYIDFTVEGLVIVEREESPDGTVWYVEATIWFQVDDGGEEIEGSTDTYECYRCGDEWCIDWHSS